MARTKQTNRTEAAGAGKIKRAKKAPSSAGAEAATKVPRKPHRFHPGIVALREIKRYQKSTDLLLRKMPFSRQVREITEKEKGDMRFQASALLALQQASETHLTTMMQNAMKIALHGKRVSLNGNDLRLAQELWNTSGWNAGN